MSDPFLSVTKVNAENAAMTETLKSALQQRQNKVCSRNEVGNKRLTFRLEFADDAGRVPALHTADSTCVGRQTLRGDSEDFRQSLCPVRRDSEGRAPPLWDIPEGFQPLRLRSGGFNR